MEDEELDPEDRVVREIAARASRLTLRVVIPATFVAVAVGALSFVGISWGLGRVIGSAYLGLALFGLPAGLVIGSAWLLRNRLLATAIPRWIEELAPQNGVSMRSVFHIIAAAYPLDYGKARR